MSVNVTRDDTVESYTEEVEYDDEEEIIEEEVEEEVEVTDAEEGSVAEQSTVSTKSPSKQKKPQTPSKAATPGKVAPSSAVKQMKMKTPDSSGKRATHSLSPDKNPFVAFGAWTPSTLSQINIVFPALGSKDETTNDLTRSSRPEARYWKAPITFKYSNFSSDTLRIENVHIPYHTGKGYGSNFVYLCLPGFFSEKFAEAGKAKAPTKVTENSLAIDNERWWKIGNDVGSSFGVINSTTKKFHQKSLESIFEATNLGVSCTVILKFKCKASTMDLAPLRATTIRTVAVEVVRGFINGVDIDVQMPTRLLKQKPKAEPVASSADVATDSLMQRLAALGL